jgi:CDP-glucose 4,6-dehydratase
MIPFQDTYRDKKVLVTGHTGFKGSWLSLWLQQMGARVYGISDIVPTVPSHFETAQVSEVIDHRFLDVRNLPALKQAINSIRPDFIFHLAAQPLVKKSYSDPHETFEVNVMGTGNILESIRTSDFPCVAVFITSDKCYDNVEWTYGYRETDALGGKDPYSGSKGAAELIIKSYFHSYFAHQADRVRMGVGRAGNVIGGADWAADRIVPDCMRSWSKGETVEIRSPHATRPWQHVLEPLSGYLLLGQRLFEELSGGDRVGKPVNGEAFNFGPDAVQNVTVGQLIEAMIPHWKGSRWEDVSKSNNAGHEAGLLKLCCDKALHNLSWKATLNIAQTVKYTVDWYRDYYTNPSVSTRELSNKQIQEYMSCALADGISWVKD